MMNAREVKKWLAHRGAESFIAVDDGGLTLVELDAERRETGDYLEIGGVPEDDDDEAQEEDEVECGA